MEDMHMDFGDEMLSHFLKTEMQQSNSNPPQVEPNGNDILCVCVCVHTQLEGHYPMQSHTSMNNMHMKKTNHKNGNEQIDRK